MCVYMYIQILSKDHWKILDGGGLMVRMQTWLLSNLL